jgi:DNA repair ATPase RecN
VYTWNDSPIETVPALKRIELHSVGCGESLSLEFLPDLNIITDEESAAGKSTIFRAILRSLMTP